jgi:hypothetical protein
MNRTGVKTMTTYQQEAAALEAEIAALDAALASEILRSGVLVNEMREVEAAMSSKDAMDLWEEIEAEAAPIFGERGIYPDFPVRWYPYVRRALQRIRKELTPEQYACIRIDYIKEKFMHLDMCGSSDHKWIDGVTEAEAQHADDVLEKYFDLADEEIQRMEKMLKALDKK